MIGKYELEPLLPEEIVRWDELAAAYPNRELFHRRAWLEYLADSRGVEIRYWAIQNGTRRVGYFCGGLVRKGPFKILGSPLKGWGTNFLGPISDGGFDVAAFLGAIDRLAARDRIAMVEMESRNLAAAQMEACGYTSVDQPTYVVTLNPRGTEALWKGVDLKARQKIRKAGRRGLVLQETADPAIADEFFQQFVEVLSRKNLYPPYDETCPRSLFRHLHHEGLLFAFAVREPAGRIVATGLFPHDGRSVYMWGAASRIDAWELSPNDFLEWAVMERAARDGLSEYNMCGYGHFKSKFGGTLRHPQRWHKCYSQGAAWARKGYEAYFRNRIRLRGWWENVARQRNQV